MTTLPPTIAYRCPSCSTPLEASPPLCRACNTEYPVLAGVPFLFPQPQLELARWEARAHQELQTLHSKHKACAKALQALESAPSSPHTPAQTSRTKDRLERLAQGYERQATWVGELLAPLLSGQPSSDKTTYDALQTEGLSDSTTLFSYETNVFRDWVWGEAENQQAVSLLSAVAGLSSAARGELGRTLVLGAGGGRLSWDIAQAAATEVVAVDINPYTSLVAQSVTANDLRLMEFPLAPVSIADVAIERQLSARAFATDQTQHAAPLQFVLADARALPFAVEQFDTVITPWFVDVVQQSPARTAAAINEMLAPGGRWLNFGSVAFANSDPANCLQLEELCALVETCGFSAPVVLEERGPYLCSPHSRYGRQELLHAFCTLKQQPAATRSETEERPAWLIELTQPVPALPIFQEQAMATQIHAYLMSLIDGSASIADIAATLEERRLMSAREAMPVIQGFLQKMLKDH